MYCIEHVYATESIYRLVSSYVCNVLVRVEAESFIPSVTNHVASTLVL